MQLSMRASLLAGRPAGATAFHSTTRSRAGQTASTRATPAERRQQAAAGRRVAVPAAAAQAGPAAAEEVAELKAALIDSFWGTERGLAASSDSRAEINELISQLEARNPTPEPNEARQALGGAWRLVYTSNSELIALLALGRLPLVTVGDITQTIDPSAMTVDNCIQLEAPGSKTSLSATASFEVRSPKLLQVSFEEGRVATPQLLADLSLPTSLDILGQQLDLAPLQAALQPVEGPLRSALGALGALLKGVPDLRIPINSPQASSWLLNTYLDDSLRITRGDGGSVFVLVREQGEGFGSASASASSGSAAAAAAAAAAASDLEALEDLDPPAATSAAPADMAPAVAAAAASSAPGVVVVEPSSVQEGDGDNNNGTSGGSASA